ncbi:MAG: hypothetical protein HY706_20410 [Candidatus Hydrogenedentes bacterium]|nr:hypothetical protein [Candidatus Hydrogenedentota bacterium]
MLTRSDTSVSTSAASASQDALAAAWVAQREAAADGFDWPSVEGVLDKLHEEIKELRVALDQGNMPLAHREVGDLLFTLVNVARFLGTPPAAALADATARFQRRYAWVCAELSKNGIRVKDCDIKVLDDYWNMAKRFVGDAPEKLT